MAKRPCMGKPGCRAMVWRGVCDACAPTPSARARSDAARPSAHKRGYTRRWDARSKRRLREHPFCVGYPLGKHGAVLVLATVTDHIRPHKGDQTLFEAEDNLQSLCETCHNTKTATEDGGFGR